MQNIATTAMKGPLKYNLYYLKFNHKKCDCHIITHFTHISIHLNGLPSQHHITDIRYIWYAARCQPGIILYLWWRLWSLCLWLLICQFWCTIKYQADTDKLKLKIAVGLNASNESNLPSYICSLAEKNHEMRFWFSLTETHIQIILNLK